MAIKKLILFIPLLAITTAAVLIASSYLKPGLPATDDGTSMVIRASGFHQSFKDGHIPVRWIQRLNENYGYPVLNFLYPLPFYLTEIFNLTGFSTLASVKTIFVLATVASGLGMYFLAKQFSTKLPALIASILFLAAPYRIADLYQRGSLGEITALAVIPFIFYFLHVFKKEHRAHHLFCAGLSWSLLITAHNSLALIFSPLILIYAHILLSKKNHKQSLQNIFIIIAIALSTSAFFWIPALHDLQFTRASSIQISTVSNFFTNFLDMINQIGIINLGILIISAMIVKNKLIKFLTISSIVVFALQLPASLPIWQLGLDRLVQFPFRLNSITAFVIPISAAYLAQHLIKNKKKTDILFLSLFTLTVLLSALNTTFTTDTQLFSDSFFETNFDTTTNQREFTPLSVKTDPQTFSQQPFEIHGRPETHQILEAHDKTQEKHVQLNITEPIEIVFNTAYFPGWNLYIDDNKSSYNTDDLGRIRTHVQPKETASKTRDIKLVWEETKLRNLANLTTVISTFLTISVIIYYSSKKSKSHTIGSISIVIVSISMFSSILFDFDRLNETFNPKTQEQRYLQSQWVDPNSQYPIGDHGLYMWAGWEYLRGKDPTLINPEMPPLGKYLIGLGLAVTKRPALVGIFFSLTFLGSLYLLSNHILKNHWLALVPVALFSTETIFRSAVTITMLDSIQLTFLSLTFFFLLKAEKSNKWFVLAALMLGAVASTKFFATAILITASIFAYYLFSKRFKQLKYFTISLLVAGLVHLLSYSQYFASGNSFRDYLGVQKFIINFYRTGSPSIPLGSYWKLVFTNQWRVWWGPRWGEYYTLATKEWQLTWPINAFTLIAQALILIRKTAKLWLENRSNISSHHILTSWLLFYSVFLTVIGGWPHYMLLFLPFSNILLAKLILDHQAGIVSKLLSAKNLLTKEQAR